MNSKVTANCRWSQVILGGYLSGAGALVVVHILKRQDNGLRRTRNIIAIELRFAQTHGRDPTGIGAVVVDVTRIKCSLSSVIHINGGIFANGYRRC